MADATIMGPNPKASAPDAQRIEEMTPLAGLTDQEFAELAASVFVAIPHRPSEGISTNLAECFGNWARLGMRIAPVKDQNAGHIDLGRGIISYLFLNYRRTNPEVRYLVMIDNDEEIHWDAPLRLAQHGLPIVSGVVPSYSDARGLFACFTAEDENGTDRFPTLKGSKVLPASGIKEVKQVGTGLVAIRADVLENLCEKYTNPFEVPEAIKLDGAKTGSLAKGEDMIFSDRAREAGYSIYVDFAVRAKHIKCLPLQWPPASLDPRISAEDWCPSIMDYKWP